MFTNKSHEGVVTELERFFRQIVMNLADTDPARLHRPVTLAEIRDSIVPYRANRRALQIESSEDYELILMQLCAGEGGFARAESEEVQALFAAELRSSNPDLGILHRHEKAVLNLEPQSITAALSPERGLAFAPPDHRAAEITEDSRAPLASGDAITTPSISHCIHCGGLLPAGRVVKFCPHCGGQHVLAHCPACGAETEGGWRHCINCAAALTSG